MDYTLHQCDESTHNCTGGGNNPHVCEVDSVCQKACATCRQYPTDPELLRKVMHNHYLYGTGQDQDEPIYYRDKLTAPEIAEPVGCQCPSQYLFNHGHKVGCQEKK